MIVSRCPLKADSSVCCRKWWDCPRARDIEVADGAGQRASVRPPEAPPAEVETPDTLDPAFPYEVKGFDPDFFDFPADPSG